MDIQKIHCLIRFILAVSNEDEDWKARELGPIHIIKYVYLADMYYANQNNGETYTGIQWKFHSFGPYDYAFLAEIPNAVKAIGGNSRVFESQYDKDGIRFSLKHTSPDEASKGLPSSFFYLLQRDIRKFGAATNDLLHYVYTTPPMTNATPGQVLDFSSPVSMKSEEPRQEVLPMKTFKEKKRQQERLHDIRNKMALNIAAKKKKRIAPAPPRYDEIFFNGSMELDRDISHLPLDDHKGVLQVNDSAWTGDWRKNIDLP